MSFVAQCISSSESDVAVALSRYGKRVGESDLARFEFEVIKLWFIGTRECGDGETDVVVYTVIALCSHIGVG